MTTPILVLDAGHGYNTAGKRTIDGAMGVVREWSMNDSVVRKIIDMLSDYDVKVYRTDDTTGNSDISLTQRVKRCNSYNPHLFVSIHHNAGGGTGTEVFWHTKGTSEDKRVANILAPKLASMCGLRNRGVKQKQLGVLTCKATAILVEGGFMDHKGDYELITSDHGQKLYAKAVAEVIVEYLGLEKKVTNPTAPIVTEPKSFKCGDYGAYVITTDDLNIRKERNHKSAIMGTIPKGTKVKVEYILGVNNSKSEPFWGSVYTQYGNGFINLKYTKPIE